MQEWLSGPWGPVLVFVLRMLDVTVATVRILLMQRARKWVPVIGFFEMLLWVLAVGGAVANLTSPVHIFAFASGHATGSWLGIRIEARLAIGLVQLKVVVREGADEVATFLRAAGFGVTQIAARGKDGPVDILEVVLPRKEAARCAELIQEEAPGAFMIMEEPTGVRAGFMGRTRRI